MICAKHPTKHRRLKKPSAGGLSGILSSKRFANIFDRTVISSDGNIGVAFNRRRPGYPGGLDYFGIEVDDLELVFARIKEKYPSVRIVKALEPTVCRLQYP